jgi:hypothetical protein
MVEAADEVVDPGPFALEEPVEPNRVGQRDGVGLEADRDREPVGVALAEGVSRVEVREERRLEVGRRQVRLRKRGTPTAS